MSAFPPVVHDLARALRFALQRVDFDRSCPCASCDKWRETERLLTDIETSIAIERHNQTLKELSK